jgi:hypothetical protein
MLPCTISGLKARHGGCVQQLISQLHSKGFGIVTVDDESKLSGLRIALQQAEQLPGFRFPPIEGDIVYDAQKREAFQALFSVAKTCLGALLSAKKPATSSSPDAANNLQVALEQGKDLELFASNPHEPFQQGQPFSQSFFNLFNYNHGLLNPHVDRSLMTIIYSSQRRRIGDSRHSTLWIQDRYGHWRDGDEAAAKEDQVIVMTGEELSLEGAAVDLDFLVPALHAVKVDPTGPNLSRPHFRPDPDNAGSRLSAALILRHEPTTKICKEA